MRLTSPKQFEALWEAWVIVRKAAFKRRGIPRHDADDLGQDLATKALEMGDPSQATTVTEWLGFLWPAARYLRSNYYRKRLVAFARFVEPLNTKDKKGDDDDLSNRNEALVSNRRDEDLFKQLATQELREKVHSKWIERFLADDIKRGEGPVDPATRQRKSRAKKKLKLIGQHQK